MEPKIIRTATVPLSLNHLCNGLFIFLREKGFETVALSSPGDDLVTVAKREGVKTYAVPMERKIAPFKDLVSLINLIKVFRKERPDMVHSITPKAGLLSMCAAWFARVPVRIHTFTGLVFPSATGLKKKLLMTTDRLTCIFATNVVPEGNGVKRDLIDNHITSKPLNVLGNGSVKGVDLSYFDPEIPEVVETAKRLKKEGVFTFIFVGRLARDKGINELIVAFKKLNQELPSTRLLLIGWDETNSDPVHDETMAEIRSNPNIEWKDFQKDVRPWLACGDCLVLPSYREGFPNVVLEAGAMALPAIVTDINGSNEIVVNGETGHIVPPKDSESLYVMMKKYATGEVDLKKLSRNARLNISSKYDQKLVRESLLEFYKNLLKKQSL